MLWYIPKSTFFKGESNISTQVSKFYASGTTKWACLQCINNILVYLAAVRWLVNDVLSSDYQVWKNRCHKSLWWSVTRLSLWQRGYALLSSLLDLKKQVGQLYCSEFGFSFLVIIVLLPVSVWRCSTPPFQYVGRFSCPDSDLSNIDQVYKKIY